MRDLQTASPVTVVTYVVHEQVAPPPAETDAPSAPDRFRWMASCAWRRSRWAEATVASTVVAAMAQGESLMFWNERRRRSL